MFKKRKIKKETVKKFAVYEGGIKRLAELKKELDRLDTRKFKREDKLIRKKLKEVSMIPEIEEDIRRLKLKIAGVDVNFLESQIDKKQDRKLRKLAFEERAIEENLPKLSHRLQKIKKEAEKAEILARRKELTKKEKGNVRDIPLIERTLGEIGGEQKWLEESVPKLQRKTSFLSRLFGKEESELGSLKRKVSEAKNAEQKLREKTIPKLQRKTSFLGELMQKNEFDIDNLENRYDKDRLEFNDKLTLELAESKRMIEDSKYAMKQQMMETLAETLKNLNKEKIESDKKLLEEIKKIEGKIDSEKKDINENIAQKMAQLKGRIEERESMEKFKPAEKAPEMKILEKPAVKPAEKPAPKLPELPKILHFPKFPKMKKADIQKLEHFREKELGFKPLPELPPLAHLKEPSKLPHFEPIHVSLHAHFPKLPELPEKAIKREVERGQIIERPRISEMPRRHAGTLKIEHLNLPRPMGLPEIMPREPRAEALLKSGVIHKRIPKKAFVEQEDFFSLIENLDSFKDASLSIQDEISRDIHEKTRLDNELAKCFANLDKIKANFGKINEVFSKNS